MKNKFVTITILSVLLAGCFSEGSGNVETKEFYMENEEARNARVKYCDENPGKALTPFCHNAVSVNEKIKRKKMMGL